MHWKLYDIKKRNLKKQINGKMCAWLEKLILILLSVDTTERCQQIQWDPYQNSNGIFFFKKWDQHNVYLSLGSYGDKS